MEESTVGPMENVTDYDYDFEFDDYNQHIVVAIAFSMASILGIIGNSLVILSVYVSKKLRTVTNAFVVNLSIADLITSLMIPWNVTILLSHEEYPIKDWGCGVVAGLLFTCIGTSLFTLSFIALNRLILITRPMKTYITVYSPFYTGIWIAATWVIPFCFNIIPPLLDVGELGTSQKYRMCVGISKHPDKDTYDLIQLVGCFPIPLVTLIVSYTWIYIHLRRHAQRLNHHRSYREANSGADSLNMSESGTLTNTVGTLPQSNDNNNMNNVGTTNDLSRSIRSISQRLTSVIIRPDKLRKAEKQRRKRENTITKNMFLVFIAFVVCFVPTALQLALDGIDGIKAMVPYATALILINACVNPIIYGFKHPYFNHVFRCLLTCKWHAIPEPSDGFKKFRNLCCRFGR
ncbi:G-protein coupled receptor moody-like [Amphiura filiformis]|uniref:G-protein coupled receptor moody-like n=1 Tax=Amphiura filiformis TaxID=82378 RepID=UPI003B2272EA